MKCYQSDGVVGRTLCEMMLHESISLFYQQSERKITDAAIWNMLNIRMLKIISQADYQVYPAYTPCHLCAHIYPKNTC